MVSQWELIYQQQPHSSKVHIFNPSFEESGWESTHTIVEVNVSPEMPFLVNSMRMELDRLGFTIHLIVHPGQLKIKRDAKHRIVDILSPDAQDEEAVTKTVDELIGKLPSLDFHVFFVTNEVGSAIVPDNPLARSFRDLVGWANQRFAQAADEVVLMVAGLPVIVKKGRTCP